MNLSSTLNQYKSPSARYESYQHQRDKFFARVTQPQDLAVANAGNDNHFDEQGFHLSFSGNSSQRKLVMDYEMRKREQLQREKQVREQIRQSIGLTAD